MKTNAQTGENRPALQRDACYLIRSLYLSWLVTLLLATSGTAPAATVTVDVGGGGTSFIPDSVTIQPGDTVEWEWNDTTIDHTHSVTSGANGVSDGLFDAGIHTGPFTFSYTFQNTGTFHYFCRPHFSMQMVGQVIVTAAGPPSQLLNISTRLRVQTGENVMIGGFIVTGSDPKRVIIRAIGPSLLNAGIPDFLADPTLELHDANTTLATNDNWKIRPDGTSQQAEIEATTLQPSNDLESAIVRTLPANNAGYTMIVSGKNATTGVGVVEAYDLDQAANSRLANISTRGLVETGSNVMIGGFILGGGTGSANVLVRAIGPSLAQVGINGALADPTLELHDGQGALLRGNDNWKIRPDGTSQQAEIEATGIPPHNDLESAITATLPPGAFTATVAGKNGTSGVALVEVYRLQ